MATLEIGFTGFWGEQTFTAAVGYRTEDDTHPRQMVWSMSLADLQAHYRLVDAALREEHAARHVWSPTDLVGLADGAIEEGCGRCPAKRLRYPDDSVVPQFNATDWCPPAMAEAG